MTDTGIRIRALEASDAVMLERWISRQPSEYLRFFHVFRDGAAGIAATLNAARRDLYAGMFLGDALVCIFTLRGWDEGFDVPAFGVVLDHRSRGRELMIASFEAAKAIARRECATRIMARVRPDNLATTRMTLRHGFVADRVDPETGHVVYYFEL